MSQEQPVSTDVRGNLGDAPPRHPKRPAPGGSGTSRSGRTEAPPAVANAPRAKQPLSSAQFPRQQQTGG